MRTHARYELQDSTSLEESVVTLPLGGAIVTDSPPSGSFGSVLSTSRSVSSESADPPPAPPPATQAANDQDEQQPMSVSKPPSPMDTEDGGTLGVAGGDLVPPPAIDS